MLVSAWDMWGRAQRAGDRHMTTEAQRGRRETSSNLALSFPVLHSLTPSHSSLLISFIPSNRTA